MRGLTWRHLLNNHPASLSSYTPLLLLIPSSRSFLHNPCLPFPSLIQHGSIDVAKSIWNLDHLMTTALQFPSQHLIQNKHVKRLAHSTLSTLAVRSAVILSSLFSQSAVLIILGSLVSSAFCQRGEAILYIRVLPVGITMSVRPTVDHACRKRRLKWVLPQVGGWSTGLATLSL